MISGIYRMSFDVSLSKCETKQDALEAIQAMLEEIYANNEHPDMNMELIGLVSEDDESEDETDDSTDLVDKAIRKAKGE